MSNKTDEGDVNGRGVDGCGRETCASSQLTKCESRVSEDFRIAGVYLQCRRAM